MITTFFPFPHIVDGVKQQGSIIKWPQKCDQCLHNICGSSIDDKIHTCSYGFDYLGIDKGIIVSGVLIKERRTSASSATIKNFKNYANNIISMGMLDASLQCLRIATQSEEDFLTEQRANIIREYIEKEQYKTDFLAEMRPDILKGLSFVHDYKQINTQISQNINVIIETHYPGGSIEDKIERASQHEKAIYYASKILEEKLNVAKFLLQPEWLEDQRDYKKSRFHGIVLKYCRIYTPHFDKKRLIVNLEGHSIFDVLANPQALSIIPHTLIDNAAKYSPIGGQIDIEVNDDHDYIDFSVSSYGPKLRPHETKKLFTLFYRGETARDLEGGTGYGLYVSQLIAKRHLGSEIFFTQSDKKSISDRFWTTFSIRIPLKARLS